jgi:aspartyl-tRNA(Asn)/glutamyl-tRNA(Gln) amidotransferase subunit C
VDPHSTPPVAKADSAVLKSSWYDLPIMSVTPLDASEVRRIAALAHLALTDDEVGLFGRQLAEILAYVRQIQSEDTTGVTPMSHAVTGDAHERADVPHTPLPRADALKNAPEAAPESGLFKVPRVMA